MAERCYITSLDAHGDADAVGERAPTALAGVRVAVKDNIAVAGVVTTAGCAARADGPPAAADAAVVARLREAGAVVAGTTNMNELAYGFTGENDWFGQVANPWDATRMSGGSSSGSAAAVAGGMVPLALGTDTNGSIRVPAALCGIWGFRPTMGSVPSDGVVPLAATLDIAGPLASSAGLLAAAARVLAGHVVSADPPAQPGAIRARVVSGFPSDGLSADVREAVRRVSSYLGARDGFVVPGAAASRAAAQVVTAVEGAAAHRALLQQRPDRVGRQTRQRLWPGRSCQVRSTCGPSSTG